MCSECADGFGPSFTSFGLRCVDCTDAWYRIPLFLIVELLPVTVFYFVVVMFQISVTSAPLPCFIMYAQLIVIAVENLHPLGQMSAVYYTNDEQLKFLDLRIAYVLYGIFNLDFFRSVLPPLCVSHELKFIHTSLFGYISVIYPIALIGLTWACVELQAHNCRLLRCFWKAFRICFARLKIRGWDKKTDFVNMFATFFLLSCSKCIYQILIYGSVALKQLTTIDQSGNISFVTRASIDGSYATYLCYVVPVPFMSYLFILLPLLLLILYPCRLFRSCISKCHLDFIAINTFVERFHGCYRNGLDGGRDMRSFSGLYFALRIVVVVLPCFALSLTKDSLFFETGALFLIVAFFVALAKPYKKAYANILEVFILSDLAMLCFYTSPCSSWFSEMAIIPRILIMTPLVTFIVIVFCKASYALYKHV